MDSSIKLTVGTENMSYLIFTLVLCLCFYFLGRYEMKSDYNRLPRQLNDREKKFVDLYYWQFKQIARLEKENKDLKKRLEANV